MRLAWIEEHRATWPVAVQCDVLDVSRSGFSGWRKRAPLPLARDEIDKRPMVFVYGRVLPVLKCLSPTRDIPTIDIDIDGRRNVFVGIQLRFNAIDKPQMQVSHFLPTIAVSEMERRDEQGQLRGQAPEH